MIESRDSQIELAHIQAYLSQQVQKPVQIEQVEQLGSNKEGAAALKAFGYGRPLCIVYTVDGESQRVVLRRVMRNGFGRERDSDRVAEIWRDFHTFNQLPQHVQTRDMVMVDENGRFTSIATAQELLLLTNYAPGQTYADNLLRIIKMGTTKEQDLQRAKALALYLANIHRLKHNDPLLWRRRLRDLIGHGEGILGLTDSYSPDDKIATPTKLRLIEEGANCWRWRLKRYSHRLSQVHGDFHPFNILFSTKTNFTVLDRSRGQWGEPADDVSCLMINYLFFSLQQNNGLSGSFLTLYTLFWNTYLDNSQDEEMITTIAPWISWRALVLASPQWYPTLSETTRSKLLNLAHNVLSDTAFDWRSINRYLETT